MKPNCRMICLALLAFALFSLPAGCGSVDLARKKDASVVPPPPIDKPQFIFHRVMAGETWVDITKWYAGDEASLDQLQEVNPDLDPLALNAGDIVKVPVYLAVVHDEQPDQSVQPRKPPKPVRKGGGKAGKVAPSAPLTNAPAVFGPK